MRPVIAWYDATQRMACTGYPDDGATQSTKNGNGQFFDNNLKRNDWVECTAPDGRVIAMHGIALVSTRGPAAAKPLEKHTKAELLEMIKQLAATS